MPPADVFAERVHEVQPHHRDKADDHPLQALFVVDGRHEQNVEDEDFEVIFDERLTAFGPRADRPTGEDGKRESGICEVLRVTDPTLTRTEKPRCDGAEHVDALEAHIAENRPDLERPVDEQEHVTDQQPVHRIHPWIA